MGRDVGAGPPYDLLIRPVGGDNGSVGRLLTSLAKRSESKRLLVPPHVVPACLISAHPLLRLVVRSPAR